VSLNSPENLDNRSAPTPVLRFVHSADLHLDSPLKSLALRDNVLAELVTNASRTTLVRLVDLCIDESVDALLIAGDLFDSDQKSMHTAAILATQMRRLHSAGIPVFIILGNHDSQAAITKKLSLPDNITVFEARAGQSTFADGKAVVHGVSFNKKQIPESLLPKYKAPVPNKFNIGMLHTSLAGSGAHDVYAPCSIAELDSFGYNYWALGHIHKRSEHHGAATIVMPGIPQGRDIGEHGVKTVSLVSVFEDNTVKVDQQAICPVQFDMVDVDITGIDEWQHLLDIIEQKLIEHRKASDTEQIIVRIVLTGRSTLHFQLVRDFDYLNEIIRESCANIGDIWLDVVKNNTNSKSDTGQSIETMPELNNIISSQVVNSSEVHQQIQNELAQITSKLPKDLKDIFGISEQERADTAKTMLRDGSNTLLSKLNNER